MMIQDLLAEAHIGTLIFLVVLFALFMSRRRKGAASEESKPVATGDDRSPVVK